MKPTKEQIIEWARAAGAEFAELPMCDAIVFPTDGGDWHSETLERFAAIVAVAAAAYAKGQEDMRERCASLAETTPKVWDCGAPPPQQRIATAIRALPIQKGGKG